MKKTFLILIFLISWALQAQDLSFKPIKNDLTLELQFTLLGISSDDNGNININNPFTINGLRFRYFFNEKWALRANVTLDYSSQRNKNGIPYHVNSDEKIFRSTFHYRIAPGFEYHFGKPERLSFYAGAELFFGGTQQKMKYESESKNIPYPDYSLDQTVSIEVNSLSYVFDDNNIYATGSRSNMNFGVNAFFGADFYIYKGLYIGAELGLGASHIFYLKTKGKGNSGTVYHDYDGNEIYRHDVEYGTTDKESYSATGFGFYCEPKIRLGFKF